MFDWGLTKHLSLTLMLIDAFCIEEQEKSKNKTLQVDYCPSRLYRPGDIPTVFVNCLVKE